MKNDLILYINPYSGITYSGKIVMYENSNHLGIRLDKNNIFVVTHKRNLISITEELFLWKLESK